jgi:NADH:ubiquinone oxidoreductase subunit 5 (subunit L)/multisubunit Na+/H+ antiporter MnhA subunit
VSDRLYVLFWNKWYVDEIYDACVVGPNLRLAGGLARRVERAVVDGALNALVTATVHVALWLWRVLEGRGLDRAVSSTSTASVATARWLWRVLEGRAIHGSEDRLSHQADAVGKFLERRQVHTLQEHLLLVVSGLAGLLGLFYVVFQWR